MRSARKLRRRLKLIKKPLHCWGFIPRIRKTLLGILQGLTKINRFSKWSTIGWTKFKKYPLNALGMFSTPLSSSGLMHLNYHKYKLKAVWSLNKLVTVKSIGLMVVQFTVLVLNQQVVSTALLQIHARTVTMGRPVWLAKIPLQFSKHQPSRATPRFNSQTTLRTYPKFSLPSSVRLRTVKSIVLSSI
jgi:hypothetical protein